MKRNIKITLIIVTTLLILGLVCAHYMNKDSSNDEEFYNYPNIYQSVPQYIEYNDQNIRLQGNGDLLVWNDTPILPLVVRCRKNNKEKELCNYIIGNQSLYPTSRHIL
jgi:hypothetical protein